MIVNDMNPRAVMGANFPPPFDPAVVQEHDEAAARFADVAGQWLDRGDLTAEEDAQKLTDFIAGARGRKKLADAARADAKRPHDDAGKAVQAAFAPILTKLDAAVAKVQPLLTKWLEAKEAARKKEAARLAEEARLAREEAARLAAQAAARNDVSGEIDAEAAMKAAADAEKAAARMERASDKVSSATGGTKAAGLRTYWRAELVNRGAGIMRYRDAPELAALLVTLAERDARAKGFDPETMTIPGFNLIAERRAV